jgi:transcription initiation factor TFIID TATA-box-binding protein
LPTDSGPKRKKGKKFNLRNFGKKNYVRKTMSENFFGSRFEQAVINTSQLMILALINKYKLLLKMPKAKATVNIENVVTTATLNQKIDLNAVVRGYPGVEYRPEQFPGLVFRLKRPKTATLIFNSGKMVCTGAKSEKESRRAVMHVIKELKKSGIIIIRKPELKTVNIVASGSLGGMIDLEKSAYDLGRTMYEPEQFPGLIYRMDDPKVVILLFASGKLVCTGAKREEDVYIAVNKLHQRLEDQKLIYYE